jgi:hypothetical protein
VDFLDDNLIALAAGVLGVIVIATAALMTVRLIALLRQRTRVRRRLEGPMAELEAKTARTQRGIDHLERMKGREVEQVAELRARLEELKVLGGHLVATVAVLRAPLRYFGK